MLSRLFLLLATLLLVLPTAVAAADEHVIDVPRSSLARALPTLSRQTGVSISVADGTLWQSPVRRVRGRMTVTEAITRLLAGSNARAVQVSPTSWRIEPRPPDRFAPRRATRLSVSPRVPGPPHVVATPPPQEIVVTASKTDLPLSQYAGVATLLDGDDLALGGERGTESILSRMASISSTYLGSGRNKLFIRGIADSSFTGPTQATVGQYLGDIRLSYNAPDPDLRLYDIQSVEVLEGPQGTLYGAGSLGGIIRITPKAPDPRQHDLQVIAGVSLTQHGAPGGDIAAIANVPLGEGGHALRLVGYSLTDGGYIDNPLLGQKNVNRIFVRGGRGTLRLDVGDGWTVDLGGVYQAITSDDAQYADRNAPPLTRNSLVEQGSKVRYASAQLVVMKDWDDLHFQTSQAYIHHNLSEVFDASQTGAPPQILDQHNGTHLFNIESRLSRPFHDGLGWVIGASFVDNRIQQRREFGGIALRAPVTGVTNQITEFTAYGEAHVEIVPHVVASGGLRFTHARLGGMGEDIPFAIALAGAQITAHRTEKDALPSASLLVTPLPELSLFARYQEGFRPGGLAIDSGFVTRFRNDHVATYEVGARLDHMGSLPFDAKLSVSYSNWRDIQADFIDGNGFPTTANIGDGRITSVSASVAVRPTPEFWFEFGGVYNDSRVDRLSPQVAFVSLARLGQIPNVASHAFRGAINYIVPFDDREFRVNTWASYIGPSRLGIGPVLGEGQGDYIDTGMAMRLGDERRGLSLTLTNVFDSRGNRFSLGTPFVEGHDGYLTPLRPRTIRLAFDIAY